MLRRELPLGALDLAAQLLDRTLVPGGVDALLALEHLEQVRVRVRVIGLGLGLGLGLGF